MNHRLQRDQPVQRLAVGGQAKLAQVSGVVAVAGRVVGVAVVARLRRQLIAELLESAVEEAVPHSWPGLHRADFFACR